MVNFYRKFLPAIAKILKPLTDVLRGNPKVLLWYADATVAFEAAKASLVSVVPLSHPAPGASISLTVDASNSHVGGVLQQYQKGGWSLLAFFSKKLSPAQEKYSTFDRELLAAHSAIRHFRFLLEGRHFCLLTASGCRHAPRFAALVCTTTAPPLLYSRIHFGHRPHLWNSQQCCRCSQPPVAAHRSVSVQLYASLSANCNAIFYASKLANFSHLCRAVLWIRIQDPDPYWIRLQSDHWIRIRICNLNTDPDPGGQK